ncbi:MAG: hypothetical protein V2B19_10295 [Pseudomonadota bacterium]
MIVFLYGFAAENALKTSVTVLFRNIKERYVMNAIKRTPVSFIDVMRSFTDKILGSVCSYANKGRFEMNNVLKRDITGECFGECRNTVREAAVKRQAKINKIIKEAEADRHGMEDSSGMLSRGFSSRASSAT